MADEAARRAVGPHNAVSAAAVGAESGQRGDHGDRSFTRRSRRRIAAHAGAKVGRQATPRNALQPCRRAVDIRRGSVLTGAGARVTGADEGVGDYAFAGRTNRRVADNAGAGVARQDLTGAGYATKPRRRAVRLICVVGAAACRSLAATGRVVARRDGPAAEGSRRRIAAHAAAAVHSHAGAIDAVVRAGACGPNLLVVAGSAIADPRGRVGYCSASVAEGRRRRIAGDAIAGTGCTTGTRVAYLPRRCAVRVGRLVGAVSFGTDASSLSHHSHRCVAARCRWSVAGHAFAGINGRCTAGPCLAAEGALRPNRDPLTGSLHALTASKRRDLHRPITDRVGNPSAILRAGHRATAVIAAGGQQEQRRKEQGKALEHGASDDGLMGRGSTATQCRDPTRRAVFSPALSAIQDRRSRKAGV